MLRCDAKHELRVEAFAGEHVDVQCCWRRVARDVTLRDYYAPYHLTFYNDCFRRRYDCHVDGWREEVEISVDGAGQRSAIMRCAYNKVHTPHR